METQMIGIGGLEGGLEKIAEAEKPCYSAAHHPPSHMVYSNGTYRYTCPHCGKVTIFKVNNPMF